MDWMKRHSGLGGGLLFATAAALAVFFAGEIAIWRTETMVGWLAWAAGASAVVLVVAAIVCILHSYAGLCIAAPVDPDPAAAAFNWHELALSFGFLVAIVSVSALIVAGLAGGRISINAEAMLAKLSATGGAATDAPAPAAVALAILLVMSMLLAACGAMLFHIRRMDELATQVRKGAGGVAVGVGGSGGLGTVAADGAGGSGGSGAGGVAAGGGASGTGGSADGVSGFNKVRFWAGLWSRIGQAVLYTLFWFWLIWVNAGATAGATAPTRMTVPASAGQGVVIPAAATSAAVGVTANGGRPDRSGPGAGSAASAAKGATEAAEAKPEGAEGYVNGTAGVRAAGGRAMLSSYVYMPVLGIFSGLMVKPVEELILTIGARLLAAVRAFFG